MATIFDLAAILQIPLLTKVKMIHGKNMFSISFNHVGVQFGNQDDPVTNVCGHGFDIETAAQDYLSNVIDRRIVDGNGVFYEVRLEDNKFNITSNLDIEIYELDTEHKCFGGWEME